MTMIYPSDTIRRAACNCRVKTSQNVGLFLVGNRAAIGYALCKKCGKQSRTDLPADVLKRLNDRMEEEARQYRRITTQ